ncbi:MAG: ATP-grasp domain-containing protein [Acidobacteria bacterium]|nr:ATP-grasp domain-containing protein [Acidobacteriota bacterium]
MTIRRVLVLVHEGLVPPATATPADVLTAPWRMEYDVVSTLRKNGYELRVIGVHDDLTPIRQNVDEFTPDIVFNLMEAFADVGVFDQNVVSYLELLRLPYTGCNPRGMTLARDKALAKKLFAYHRVPVPDFKLVPLNRKASLPAKMKFPLIVKSATYESSTGISQASVVENEEQLARRVQFIHESIGTPALVEQYIDGRELYVGVIGNLRLQAFPVWEMYFSKMSEQNWHIATERVKWSAAYQDKHGIETGEAELTPEVAAQAQHLAKRAYRALDLSGYGRIDLRLRADGKMFVIEGNPNPQLAEGEDFAESALHAGVGYAPLLDRIMSLGLQWRPARMAAGMV